MKCEFCDKRNTVYPPEFIANDGWWHICPKCKSSWYQTLIKRGGK